MPTISKTSELPAEQQKVWDTLTDPSRFGDWQTVHAGFAGDPPADISQGTTFQQKVTIMGMPGEVKWTVEEMEAPNRMVLRGEGPMGTKATSAFELSGNGEATRVSWENGFEGAVLAPMQGALEQQTGKALDESLEKLKALVS